MSVAEQSGGFAQARRRVVIYTVVAAAIMLGYALAYQYAMAALEGQTVGFIEAVHVVVETFTTTGYGEDASQWSTDGMLVLMISMQLTGVTLIFLTLPLFLVPLVEAALRTDPPTETDLSDHVIICTFTPRGQTLVNELESMGTPYVVVEADHDEARRLYKEGYSVVYGDPESVDDLRAANAEAAMALVADDDDETNASIILSAKQASPELRVLSMVENSGVADYHRYAGADKVVSPRHLLGENLANKAATSINTDLGDSVEIGQDFEIAELLVQQGSYVEGRTIAESGIGDIGVKVIGAWFRGDFVSPPAPDAVVDEHTILLVAGRESQLESLKELTLSETRRYRQGKVVVAGYGEVGATASDVLASANVPTIVLDKEDAPRVDVVGDVTDRQTLEAAELDDARAIILALDSDTTAIFATLVIKQVAPNTEVIARANEYESISKLYRAGAEYVLALSTVSGRMLASNLTEEEVLAPEAQIEVVRTTAPGLIGQSLAEASVRARTNCTVIAVERDGELLTDVGPEFVVQRGDELIVAGTDTDVNRFNELVSVGQSGRDDGGTSESTDGGDDTAGESSE